MSLFPGLSPNLDDDEKGATFNADRTHRYRCWRTWDTSKPLLAWLMLNPSTADERDLDPTLKRVRAFSVGWGFGGFEVWNLWSLRSTDPAGLWALKREGYSATEAAINLTTILTERRRFSDAVCAWGDFSGCPSSMRVEAEKEGIAAARIVKDIGQHSLSLWCLGQTKSGQPRHPLYIRGDQPRLPFRPTGTAP